MKENTIELSKVIELIQEVKQESIEFINGLKESIFVYKEGNHVNPQDVLIGYYDGKYILQIEDDRFALNDNDDVIFVTKKTNTNEILRSNYEVIKNTLNELQSNEPRYFVASTNVPGYMTFKVERPNLIIEYDNGINIDTIIAGSWKNIKYEISKDSITHINEIKESMADSLFYNGHDIDDSFGKIIIKNTQINIDELPLILKTRLNNKKSFVLK